ncbi:hydantoinase/oxoprolinase family protein [Nocardia farcinica]|uniref:Acetone carboxylase beta subunit n=1 Tax=Nocardia farcinica TaxID=37329 RepID=A0A449GFA8_NOCFR|nr:hydantoinase/oxoprolinase family protein [Nocardia farcinica]VFA91245.1 Acetone carboxylase beta subunit [Nocardia farcinica]
MRVATDIGGTFTDLAYIDDNGTLRLEKSSSTPGHFEIGVDNVLGKAGIDAGCDVDAFIHGTTVVINALLERKGTTTALLTTAGFRDVLEIGRASRPDLYNFRYRKPEQFVPRHLRFDIDERCDQDGNEIRPLSEEECRRAAIAAREAGAKAIAISFLHAYANPAHERRCADLIRGIWPEAFITMSHECTQEWREYERTNTAVLNAYVQETATTYLDLLERGLDKREITKSLFVMQSNGGVVSFPHARDLPITLVESGPSAGVMAAARLGARSGRPDVITLDIGGTTAKTSLIDNGEVRITTDYIVDWSPERAGYPIKAPVVDIVEIGAGGGSIAWVDELGRLGLGPESAGADPGPACYARGGTRPTLTDANLVAGRIDPDYFLGGQMEVSLEHARAALATIAEPLGLTIEDAALGVIRLANAKMINAIKLVSVRRGYDPRDFHLMAFGGGGPVHAVALGAELRVKGVIIPPAPGNFSAVGMLLTNLRADWVRTRVLPVSGESADEVADLWRELENRAGEYFARENVDRSEVTLARAVDLRYEGQEHTVTLPIDADATAEAILADFHRAHERAYTFSLEVPVQFVNFHLTAHGPDNSSLEALHTSSGDVTEAAPKGHRMVLFDRTGQVRAEIYERRDLPTGVRIDGPVVIEEPASATVVEPGQHVLVDEWGNLVVEWNNDSSQEESVL